LVDHVRLRVRDRERVGETRAVHGRRARLPRLARFPTVLFVLRKPFSDAAGCAALPWGVAVASVASVQRAVEKDGPGVGAHGPCGAASSAGCGRGATGVTTRAAVRRPPQLEPESV